MDEKLNSSLSEYFLRMLDARRYGWRVELLAEDLHAVQQFVLLQHAHAEPEHAVGKVLGRYMVIRMQTQGTNTSVLVVTHTTYTYGQIST